MAGGATVLYCTVHATAIITLISCTHNIRILNLKNVNFFSFNVPRAVRMLAKIMNKYFI
jgi:hypothetical protein